MSAALFIRQPGPRPSHFPSTSALIYLSDGNDLAAETLPLDEDDAVTDFDPQVIRKR
jgi:hypothetical protein